jgi:hypothetical protein
MKHTFDLYTKYKYGAFQHDFGQLSSQTNCNNWIRNDRPLFKNQICNTLINNTNFSQ